MKTKNELADDYVKQNIYGKKNEQIIVRTAFLAGYRAAMNELASLPLDEVAVTILHELKKNEL